MENILKFFKFNQKKINNLWSNFSIKFKNTRIDRPTDISMIIDLNNHKFNFSGVAFVYKQDFFNTLYEELGIALENIVYYKVINFL